MGRDIEIRNAAFQRVKELEFIYGDAIPSKAIRDGFDCLGESVLLLNQAQGIFKPKLMSRGPISIKTTIPKGNNVNIYNDQLIDSGFYQYSLERGDPHGERNVLLWQAYEDKTPFIYFHAVSPAVYKAMWPCFVQNILPELGYAEIVISAQQHDSENHTQNYTIPSEIESRYAVRETKIRLHQASFREAVLSVYKNRCAVSGMPVPKLLEAAHIIPDRLIGDIQTVSNGIALSRVHHRAYDANLLGIDPDYRVHISEELMIPTGGPLLTKGILEFDGKTLILPKKVNEQPNKDYLARRFEDFTRYNN